MGRLLSEVVRDVAPARSEAQRSAFAAIVRLGLTPPDVGSALPSMT